MRRRKLRAALVEWLALKRRDQRHQSANWIFRMLRVSDMTLFPAHDHMAIERAAPADLDRIAQCLLIARFAENAMIEFFAPLIRPCQQFGRAIDRDAFFVTGDQER